MLDLTKEFQPFGAVAKRGDALYVRSDEAFSKPLKKLTVSIQVMQEGGSSLSSAAGGSGVSAYVYQQVDSHVKHVQSTWSSAAAKEFNKAYDELRRIIGTPPKARLEWQRRTGGDWTELEDVGSTLTGFTKADVGGAEVSEPVVIGGDRGYMIRAFLAAGDFGWSDYQAKVAAFATAAVEQPRRRPCRCRPLLRSSRA